MSDLFYLQPDLLNFKKGWMTKLYEDGMVNWCQIVRLQSVNQFKVVTFHIVSVSP